MGVDLVSAVIVTSVVGGCVCLGLAAVAWRHREVPAALPFGAMMLAVSAWAFAAAAILIAETANSAYLAERVVRTAGAQVPPLWVLFALAFAGHERWVNWRTIAVLWAVPFAYVAATVTAPVLGLASTQHDVFFLTRGEIREPVVEAGIAHDLHLVAAYLMMVVGYGILASFLIRSRAVYRKQTLAIVGGSLAPVLVNAGQQFGLTPHPGIDVTPVAFVVTGLLFGWALVRYDFLTVTPMAGDVLVDDLPDPVFVLDEDGRILDLNPAAASVLDVGDAYQRRIDGVVPGWPDDPTGGDTLTVAADGRADRAGPRYFEVSVSWLEDQYGTARSRLVVLRDVTGQQRRQDRLEAIQEATRQFLAASTDEEIASIAVDSVDDVIDPTGTAVFLTDESSGTLEPVAVTDAVESLFDRTVVVQTPATDPDHATDGGTEDVPESDGEPGRERESDAEADGARAVDPVARAFRDGETVSTDETPGGHPVDRLLALPLGDHGVLAIGAEGDPAIGPDDEGFATILARTTQVALTRVERESELRRNRSSLERRSEQIAFFNGVLRHTLRNALLVIQGRAEVLRESVPGEAQPHLDTIEEWCADLDTLSEEIRDVNDTVTATESERLEAVDISHLLVQRARLHEERHPGVSIDLDVDHELAILGNDLARRVIDGVIENAIVHNDRPTPSVDIWTVRAADRIQVHVADDGPGMDDEMKAVVFERDLTTTQTASGFGLYFVSVLMNLYGGTVWFEDNEPRGTVAVLEFQAADGRPADGDGARDIEAAFETAFEAADGRSGDGADGRLDADGPAVADGSTAFEPDDGDDTPEA